ncbi:MAG TPA: hypothetical protein VFS43_45720, partial [Polyangiaceae bacterium]|nr:hypothetical protein [Polyangiaceae bacterium]
DTSSVASLGWVGEYAYACNFPENQLYRISVRDGSVETADLPCDAATSHQGGILVLNGLSAPEGGGLWHFDSFEAAQLGRPQQTFDITPYATRIATNGGRAYAAWHSTPSIETAPIEPGGALSQVNLQGFDDWVWAMDVLDDGRLLINSGYFSNVDGFLVFDAQTGESKGIQQVQTGGQPLRLTGLDCVSGARR